MTLQMKINEERAEAREEGRLEGRLETVSAFVKELYEDGIYTKQQVIQKLIEKLDVSEKEANNIFDEKIHK